MLIVGYDCGLIELVHTDERSIVGSYKFEEPILGVCGNRINESIIVFSLLKADKITCMQFDGREWVSRWSNSCKTAVSFAKPLLVNNGTVIVYVSSGQHKLAFAKTIDGSVEREVDISSVSGARGMVTDLRSFAKLIVVLLESGVVVIMNEEGCVKESIQVVFPIDPMNESIIPTGVSFASDGTVVVGFSSGDVQSVDGFVKYMTAHGGVGCICDVPKVGKQVIGTWKGKLHIHSSDTVSHIPSPHACSVSQISANREGSYLAVGSADGRVSVWNL